MEQEKFEAIYLLKAIALADTKSQLKEYQSQARALLERLGYMDKPKPKMKENKSNG